MSGGGAPESGWTNTRHNDSEQKNGKSTRRSNTKNPKSMKLSDDDGDEKKNVVEKRKRHTTRRWAGKKRTETNELTASEEKKT